MSAFTLVELLVVIGIISILIAILLPAVNRARKHSEWIKCAANLRSIGHAMAFYVQEYGHYPSLYLVEGGPGGMSAVWPPRLLPFLDGNKDVLLCPSRDDRFRWDDSGPEPLARAVAPYTNAGYKPGEPMISLGAHFSYGYNGSGYDGDVPVQTQKGLGLWPKVAGVSPAGPHDDRYGEMRSSRIRMPAQMIAVADSDGNGIQDYIILPSRSVGFLPGTIHSGGANVLFCDGHVAWYAQADLTVNIPPTAEDLPKIRMWNNDHRAPGDK